MKTPNKSSASFVQKTAASILAVSLAMTSSVSAGTLPTNPSVTHGFATFTTSADALTVNNGSDASIISWDTYSIGRGNQVTYTGAGDTLNRVNNGVSQIDGVLSAVGDVYLINANGIVVGSTGVINAAGFYPTVTDISDADFLAGNAVIVSGGDADVVNAGTINAGDVVIAGKNAINTGTINGNDITLDASEIAANSGTIVATGDDNRVIIFSDGTTISEGVIDSDGGFVETSGAALKITTAPNTNGGTWLIDPTNITVAGGANKYDGPLDNTGGPYELVSSATIGSGLISDTLTGGNTVILDTSFPGGAGGQDGDIVWNADATVKPVGEGVLKLIADDDIFFEGKIAKGDFGIDVGFYAGGSIHIGSLADISAGKALIETLKGDIVMLAGITETQLGNGSTATLQGLNQALTDNANTILLEVDQYDGNDIIVDGKVRTREGDITIATRGNFRGSANTKYIRADLGGLDITAVGDISLNGKAKLMAGNADGAGDNITLRADSIEMYDAFIQARGGMIIMVAAPGQGDVAADSDVYVGNLVDGPGTKLDNGNSDENGYGGLNISAANDVTIDGNNTTSKGRGGDVSIWAGNDVFIYKKIQTKSGADNGATPDREGAGNVTVRAENGDVVLGYVAGGDQPRGEIQVEDGNVLLEAPNTDGGAGGNVYIKGKKVSLSTKPSDFSTRGDITVTAANDIVVNTAMKGKTPGGDFTFIAGGDFELSSLGGDYNSKPFIQTSTKGGTIGGAVTIEANNITVKGGGTEAGKNKAWIRAGGSNGNLTMTARAGNVHFLAGGSSLNDNTATGAAAKNQVTIRSQEDMQISATGNIIAEGGDVDVTGNSEKSKVTVFAEGADVDLTAGGDIKFLAGSAAKSDAIFRVDRNEGKVAAGVEASDVKLTAGGSVIFANGGSNGARAFLGKGGKFGAQNTGRTSLTVSAGGDVQLAQDLTVSHKSDLGVIDYADIGHLLIETDTDANDEGAFLTDLATNSPSGDAKAALSIYLRTGHGDLTVDAGSTYSVTLDKSLLGDFETLEGDNVTRAKFNKTHFQVAPGYTTMLTTPVPIEVATLGLRSDGGAVSVTGLQHTILAENTKISDNDLTIQTDGTIAVRANIDQKGDNDSFDATGSIANPFDTFAITAVEDIRLAEKSQIKAVASGGPDTNITLVAGRDVVMEIGEFADGSVLPADFSSGSEFVRTALGGNLSITAGNDIQAPRIFVGGGDGGSLAITAGNYLDIGRTESEYNTALTAGAGGITQGAETAKSDRLIIGTTGANAHTITSAGSVQIDFGGEKTKNEVYGEVTLNTGAVDIFVKEHTAFTGTINSASDSSIQSAKGNITESSLNALGGGTLSITDQNGTRTYP